MHYLRRMPSFTPLKCFFWLLPSCAMIAYTLFVALSQDFAPVDIGVLNLYLFFLGVFVVPNALFALCSCIGFIVCRIIHSRINWGNLAGLLLAFAAVFITIYGSMIGFKKLDVRYVDYHSRDIPEAFNGYRIVHFSDAHVGSYRGDDTRILSDAVDRINGIGADAIVFTGDLQNMHPREIEPVSGILSRLKAKDGVFSVLGNHDYAEYVDATDAEKKVYERGTQECERKMGWQLLMNENRVIRRGNDSIVIAGMENEGRPPFPQKGNLDKTMSGVGDDAFVVMLQHDPTAWRRSILPKSHAQLTLSGHTHAMQFSIFGWSPASLVYDEWGGMFYEGDRAVNVSVGLGGFIPFRFGATGEIVVITLHSH